MTANLCKECQTKFDKQLGDLLLRDMCEECRNRFLVIAAGGK